MSGRSRIRTCEDRSRLFYRQPPLTAWIYARDSEKGARRDSNPAPGDSQSPVRTVTLRAPYVVSAEGGDRTLTTEVTGF